tara:strand:+ start:3742 stop:4470 length:729 start_codon:yes stop_codon:yes gene_type:complete
MAVSAGTVMSFMQMGVGLADMAEGNAQQKRAERDRIRERGEMEDTRYADYNQAYYDELKRREQVGLPEEQRLKMAQGADRAASVGLAATEDRRGGLIGIGRSQAGLSNAYRDIGMADVAARQQNAQQMLGEMGYRGAQTYQEQMQLNQLDYATAEQLRQEGLSREQAGRQMAFDGGSNMATSMGGQQQQPNLYGSNTPQQNAFTPNYNPSFNSFQPTGMNTTPGGFTYNTSPSLSQNNSPFI